MAAPHRSRSICLIDTFTLLVAVAGRTSAGGRGDVLREHCNQQGAKPITADLKKKGPDMLVSDPKH